ncbi:MAG: thymidine phosphorylase [Chloroflexi bacterium]|nr:thymidine phosphorylase [Chloroflexota bacterium]
MRMIDIIGKKRDGESLTAEEIRHFVEAYTAGTIPDYQVSALLMAIIFQGMDRGEIVALTIAMAESGDMLDLSDILDYAVDKHSSGGVGDKTSLVVLPLVAAFGVPIAKMSGRGLGFTGGTLDKLESIAGFNVNLSEDQFRRVARDTGLVLAGQSKSLAPADGKLYALRDVTGTVASLPLMASSIMSKKLAAGANGIVLDVKLGQGAFMKTLDEARQLATIMVRIGVDAGRDMVALLSDMNQPLGVAVGNALEVAEAVKTLRGQGPADFEAHCVEVAAYMLRLAGQGKRWLDPRETSDDLRRMLRGGAALEHFRRMVEVQGGDVARIDDLGKLPQAQIREELRAAEDGYIGGIHADKVGLATLALGAGRATKAESIDHAVGIEVHANVGDAVARNDLLMTIHANGQDALRQARSLLDGAVVYSDTPVDPLPLFYGVIDGADV